MSMSRLSPQPTRLMTWNRQQPRSPQPTQPQGPRMAADALVLSRGATPGAAPIASGAPAPDLAALLRTLDPQHAIAFLQALIAILSLGLPTRPTPSPAPSAPEPAPGGLPPVVVVHVPSAPAAPTPAAPPTVTVPVPPATPQAPAGSGVPPLPSGVPVMQPDLHGDAAAQLQAAIDALGDQGGILELPPGTFTLNRPVSLRSNVHLVGVPGQTVLKADTPEAMFRNFDSAHTSLRGLTLDGQNKAIQGMYAGRCTDVGIYGCEIKNLRSGDGWATGMGVYFETDVSDSRIIGNHIHDLGGDGNDAKAILMGPRSNNVQITHNRIEHVDRNGVFIYGGCQDAYLAHNSIKGVRGLGISIEVFEHNTATVEHNEVSGWISFDTSGGVIRHNTVDGKWAPKSPEYGIEVVQGHGVQVSDNTVRAVKHGLSVVGTEQSLFQNNTVTDVGWGSQVYGEDTRSHGNRYIGNTFQGRGDGRGIFLNGQGDYAVLEGNTVEGFEQNFSTNATDRATLTIKNNQGF